MIFAMEPIKAIMSRRRVRKFESRQIPDEVLEKILRAGTDNPFALALQPWAFVVMQDQDFLKRISGFCISILMSRRKNAHDRLSELFRSLP